LLFEPESLRGFVLASYFPPNESISTVAELDAVETKPTQSCSFWAPRRKRRGPF
jgi:hypothetical protein